jgi:ribosomal-protein-alanine N-acetyltransferase
VTERPEAAGFRVSVLGATGFRVVAALFAEAFDEPWPEPSVRDLMAGPGTRALIAADGDTPVGFLLARVVVDEAEILSVGVRPAARGRGVAHALFDAFLPMAQAAGARSVFLEVGQDNPAALTLYDRLGFERVGLRRDYYTRRDGARVDAVLMRLSLATTLE